jgi:predicted enzyme related to lactoylglutathione lyase
MPRTPEYEWSQRENMNLNSIMIGSESPQRLKSYYTKLFGAPAWDDGAHFGWQIGNCSFMIGGHDQVKGKNSSPGRVMWNIEAPDVRGEFQRRRIAGASVVREPCKPDESAEMWIATLSDPDNNYFQLMSPM